MNSFNDNRPAYDIEEQEARGPFQASPVGYAARLRKMEAEEAFIRWEEEEDVRDHHEL